MNLDIWIVTSVLTATIIAFVLDRFRMDLVALVSLLVLTLSGILTPAEATAGFSNSLVLLIAGLFRKPTIAVPIGARIDNRRVL